MRISFVLVLHLLALCGGCERESRTFKELPAASARSNAVRLTTLQPGEPQPPSDALSPYQKNAFGISEGKRLYQAMNCNGCHAQGGGGIGPALMDDKWIYGADPEQIESSILQGRPNGMPSFAGHLTDQQVWQLVAYVQSLSGMVPEDAASGRDDDLAAKKPEMRKEREQPRQTGHR
jgi:cytochrome c oxidase cbb3-type subunit III